MAFSENETTTLIGALRMCKFTHIVPSDHIPRNITLFGELHDGLLTRDPEDAPTNMDVESLRTLSRDIHTVGLKFINYARSNDLVSVPETEKFYQSVRDILIHHLQRIKFAGDELNVAYYILYTIFFEEMCTDIYLERIQYDSIRDYFENFDTLVFESVLDILRVIFSLCTSPIFSGAPTQHCVNIFPTRIHTSDIRIYAMNEPCPDIFIPTMSKTARGILTLYSKISPDHIDGKLTRLIESRTNAILQFLKNYVFIFDTNDDVYNVSSDDADDVSSDDVGKVSSDDVGKVLNAKNSDDLDKINRWNDISKEVVEQTNNMTPKQMTCRLTKQYIKSVFFRKSEKLSEALYISILHEMQTRPNNNHPHMRNMSYGPGPFMSTIMNCYTIFRMLRKSISAYNSDTNAELVSYVYDRQRTTIGVSSNKCNNQLIPRNCIFFGGDAHAKFIRDVIEKTMPYKYYSDVYSPGKCIPIPKIRAIIDPLTRILAKYNLLSFDRDALLKMSVSKLSMLTSSLTIAREVHSALHGATLATSSQQDRT